MSRIVGIDLGTSTSEISILSDGKPLIIPNTLGEMITPSVVGLGESGEWLVGQAAREQMLLRPQETVIEFKRLMGSPAEIKLGSKTYSPPEISAVLLAYLMKCASAYLGQSVDRAVITVPAYFSDEQRRATVEAGKLAGIRVERIINEPTAAALDYGIEHMQECKNILVYDLGGGTLDVTVLELFAGILDVKASSGNNHLGGKDFDSALMDWLLERFQQQYGQDLSNDIRAMMRLKEAAESCKIRLSTEPVHQIFLPFIAEVHGKPAVLEETVSRIQLEELIHEKIESTASPIHLALQDAGLKPADIDLVLLVGGSTRIPYVRQYVAGILGKEPQALVDPDLAVARGAAIQAAIMNHEFLDEKDILITDVCPYTLGLAVLGEIDGVLMPDIFDPIITRNTTIPVNRDKIYGTVADGQTKVEIQVFQGDYKRASRNNPLGQLSLSGIPPAPAFKEKVKVSFSYDVNGILQVAATILSTGRNADVQIETTGVTMNDETDLDGWVDQPNARKYRLLLNKAQKLLDRNNIGDSALELDIIIKDIKRGLIGGLPAERLDEMKSRLQELLYDLNDVKDLS